MDFELVSHAPKKFVTLIKILYNLSSMSFPLSISIYIFRITIVLDQSAGINAWWSHIDTCVEQVGSMV